VWLSMNPAALTGRIWLPRTASKTHNGPGWDVTPGLYNSRACEAFATHQTIAGSGRLLGIVWTVARSASQESQDCCCGIRRRSGQQSPATSAPKRPATSKCSAGGSLPCVRIIEVPHRRAPLRG